MSQGFVWLYADILPFQELSCLYHTGIREELDTELGCLDVVLVRVELAAMLGRVQPSIEERPQDMEVVALLIDLIHCDDAIGNECRNLGDILLHIGPLFNGAVGDLVMELSVLVDLLVEVPFNGGIAVHSGLYRLKGFFSTSDIDPVGTLWSVHDLFPFLIFR